MSYLAVKEISYDLPASTVSAANGGFTADNNLIGRWVEKATGNTVVLLGNNNRPLGVITRFTGTKVAVAVGPVVRGKKGQDAVIAYGERVTGATRVESAGGSADRGFVKAEDTTSAATLANARGYTVDGGTVTTANTPGVNVEVMLW